MNAIPIKVITENSISTTVIVAWVGVALSIVGLIFSFLNYWKSREKIEFYDIVGRYFPSLPPNMCNMTQYSAFVRLIISNKSSNPLSIVFVRIPDLTTVTHDEQKRISKKRLKFNKTYFYNSSVYINGDHNKISIEKGGVLFEHTITNPTATPFVVAPYTATCVSVLFLRCPSGIDSVENIVISTPNKTYVKEIEFMEISSDIPLAP